MINCNEEKHDIEEQKSWNFYEQRLQDDEESLNRRLKKHNKKHSKKKGPRIPEPDSDTFHAMMIDAGSQGTRLHIYEFPERLLFHRKEITQALNGYKLSLPTTNSRWTNRLRPGLDSLASIKEDGDLENAIEEYLSPLLNFTKSVLSEKVDDWDRYPIYLKATGGLRTLPTQDRVRLITMVRKVFHNTTFNPFQFQDERARVISGEEEAIYGWTAVNFIKGTLVQSSEGAGTVLSPHLTYGMIEMGGASTQIAFFEPNGDVMANLFKLQIGGARHWNIYVHSFLYFGVNGAWSRLNARLYDNGLGTSINPCLPPGYAITYESWIHTNSEEGYLLPRGSPESVPYTTTMTNDKSDFEQCSNMARVLLRKEANLEWVDFSHDGDASFAGVYQPPLPTNTSSIGGFIATSNFADIWEFLELEETSAIKLVQKKAKAICEMHFDELTKYNSKIAHPVHDDELHQMCFRSIFVYEMFTTGYEFPEDYEITAVDTLDNQKLGWSLGSILYEVNSLPWDVARTVQVAQVKHAGKDKNKTEASVAAMAMNPWNHGSGISMSESTVLLVAVLVALVSMLAVFRRRRGQGYREIPSGSTRMI